MKRKIKLSLSIILIAVMMLNVVFANDIISGTITDLTPGDGTIDPMAQCNHSFTNYFGTLNNFHTYYCSNGCGSLQREACYIFDCINYPNEYDAWCERCGETLFEDVHEYCEMRKGSNKHDIGCSVCGTVLIEDILCSPSTTWYIWRHYIANFGHYIGHLCSCGRVYRESFYNPLDHASGVDPNCIYCTMSEDYCVFDNTQ